MAQLRHIAYRVDDTEAMAKFFVEGLGMTVAQRRANGAIDLSDGVINITLLDSHAANNASGHHGIEHIGFTVTDEAETRRLMEAAGATEMNTIALGSTAHYEVKYQGPEGIVVDIGHWAGTAPVAETEGVAAR